MKTTLILILIATASLQAHWPWIEPGTATVPARAHFGVYPADRMAGPQIQAMKAAQFWSVDSSGGFKKLTPEVEADALNLGVQNGVIMSYPFGVYAGHGPASLIIFAAKAFRGAPATASPEVLPLDILAVSNAVLHPGKPATFRLLRNGKPLPAATVFAYTAAQGTAHSAALKAAKASGHDHAHDAKKEGNGELPSDALKATSNANGEFTFNLPAAGVYQLHVTVREATPGQHQGKAYESVTLVATLRLDVK